MNDFHSFSQTATKKTLSKHEAERGISDQRNNLTRFIMHRKLTESGAELAAKKLARKRWRGRGSSPDYPPPRSLG